MNPCEGWFVTRDNTCNVTSTQGVCGRIDSVKFIHM